MITEAEIGRSARELVEHYGREAIGIARDRVEELRNSGDYLAMDVALRILTPHFPSIVDIQCDEKAILL